MPRSPRIVVAALLMLCLLAVGHGLMYRHWLEDDAYISFRYARHLADGQGAVYNPGERVEGFSNPSWVLLGAAGLTLGADPVLLARAAGILSALATVLLAWWLAARRRPDARWSPLLAPLILALSPVFCRQPANGLETTFYGLLLTGLVALAEGQETRGRRLGAGLLGLLLALTRPEGVALALAVLLTAGRRGGHRGRWTAAAVCGGGFALATLGRLAYYGQVVPNTFHAKMTGGRAGLSDGVHYLGDWLLDHGGLLLVVLAAAGLLLDRQRQRDAIRLAAAGAGLGFVVLAGGDWMAHHRFVAPVLPVLAVLAAGGAGALARIPARPVRRLALGAAVGAGCVTLALSAATEWRVWTVLAPEHRPGSSRVDGYAAAGRWLQAAAGPDDLVAASDIGALGWTSGLPILDMFGLVDAPLARQPGKLHHKSDPAYVLARNPAWVVLIRTRDGVPAYWRIPDADLAADPRFSARYALVHVIPRPALGEAIEIHRRGHPLPAAAH